MLTWRVPWAWPCRLKAYPTRWGIMGVGLTAAVKDPRPVAMVACPLRPSRGPYGAGLPAKIGVRGPVAQRIEQRFPKPRVGCSSHPRATSLVSSSLHAADAVGGPSGSW